MVQCLLVSIRGETKGQLVIEFGEKGMLEAGQVLGRGIGKDEVRGAEEQNIIKI
jgi:hypothetical protein